MKVAITVKIDWSEYKKHWEMRDDRTGCFIQEFFPCKNMKRFFPMLSQDEENKYKIVINKID